MPTDRPCLTVADACAVIGEAGFGSQPYGVGIELEWFVVDSSGRRFVDPASIRAALDAGGPLPNGSRITFEPGGQLELSTPPAPDGVTALEQADADSLAARIRLAGAGLALVAAGNDPGPIRKRVVDEPRYRAMDDYFAARGCAGASMMRSTAAMQVNVGFDHDIDAHWAYAHDLAPILAAMFANSPFVGGTPSGWQSTRLATWAALDPARTRAVAGTGARTAWIQYALDAPVMLVHVDGDCIVPEQLTLRSWITEGHDTGHPTEADVEYHLTTLFPPIRPRGWIELRVLDALPEPWWHVAAAVSIAALSDAALRSDLAPRIAGAHRLGLAAAWHGVHHPPIATFARSVMTGALEAIADLGFGATVVGNAAEFLDRYVEAGRAPADDRLDEWRTTGRVMPLPEPVPTPAR